MRIVKKLKEGVLISYCKEHEPQFVSWKEFEQKYVVVDGFIVDYRKPTLADLPVFQTLKKSGRNKK